MKKIFMVLLGTILTCSICFNPILGLSYEFTEENINVRDSFDQGDPPFNYRDNFASMDICIYPDENMTYKERLETKYLETIDDMFQLFNIGRINYGTDEYKNIANAYGLDYTYLSIYRKDEIQDTFNAYYGTDIDVLSLPDLYEGGWTCRTQICGDYFVFYAKTVSFETDAQWRRGYKLGYADYWIWALRDITYNKIKSPDIHTIVKTETVHGYTFPSIEYIGFDPPSDELIANYVNSRSNNISDWETGQFQEIMRIGDYIYYEGNYRDESGINLRDGMPAICLYNTKTHEDKTIIPRGHDMQVIGDKIWAVSGVSSGSWSRDLYCFDFDGSNMKHITSGFDVCVPIDGRMYIGYDEDISYCGVKSCTLNGDDIRTEVEPVAVSSKSIELCAGYAIIDGKIYLYVNTGNVIKIQINNKEIRFDNPPIMVDNRTLVPMRRIFEELGARVSWEGLTKTVTAVNGEVRIEMIIGDKFIYVNEKAIGIDTPAQLIAGTTYIPVRAVAEAFNAEVFWDGDTHTVFIQGNNTHDDVLLDFLANKFAQEPLEMQSDSYFDIINDNYIVNTMQKCDFYKLIDIDNDGINELAVSSNPLDNNIYGQCISIWDCDVNGNVVALLAKVGQQSRSAYRYFIVDYDDKIYLLESAGERSSGGHISIRNLYIFNNNEIELLRTFKYDSFSGTYLIDNEKSSEEHVKQYIDDIDNNAKFIFNQFQLI